MPSHTSGPAHISVVIISERLLGGTPFPAGDRSKMRGETEELSCVRHYDDATLAWETLNADGNVQQVIYDTSDSNDILEPYEFIDNDPEGSNDFSIRFVVDKDTSVFTRCRIDGSSQHQQYEPTSETAMIFTIGKS